MLKKVKHYIEVINSSDKSFHQYYVEYMMKVQDQNIDSEIKSQIKFGLLQLSQYDKLIESDYRKMVNDRNAKLT